MATKTYVTDVTGTWIEKDPLDVLDYSFDWTDILATSGNDTNSSSVWGGDSGITIGASTGAGAVRTTIISGGSVGQSYAVTNKIVTVGGRTIERSFRLDVKTL